MNILLTHLYLVGRSRTGEGKQSCRNDCQVSKRIWEFTVKHLNQSGINPKWTQQFHPVKASTTLSDSRQGWDLVERKTVKEQLKRSAEGPAPGSLVWLCLLRRKMTTQGSASHTATCSAKRGVCQFTGKYRCHGGHELDDKKTLTEEKVGGRIIRRR